ncbi:MAG: von Willebrand factor type [Chthoniobacteraceae bacterium]|nr:von Willebrand factor type [Chthoniobacteraceae bacterium]
MNSDDPILTAYALGDLDPKAQAAFEELLNEDFAALAEINATRVLAADLRTQLRAAPSAPLLASQRAAIFEAAQRRDRPIVVFPFWKRPVLLSAAAACVIVGVSMRLLWPVVSAPWKSNPQARQSAPSFHFTLDNGPLELPREPLVPFIAAWEASSAQALVGPPRIAFTQTSRELPFSRAFLPSPRFASLSPNPPSVVRRVDEKASIARNSDAGEERRRGNWKSDLKNSGHRLISEKLGAFYPSVSEEQPAFSLDSGAAVYSRSLGL